MMSIRRLFVLISLLYSAVMAAGFVTVHLAWLYPEKVNDTLTQQTAELESLSRQLEHIQKEVHTLALDYAKRGDVIDFLATGQQKFLTRVFTPDHFELLQLDGAIFLDEHDQYNQAYFYQDGILNTNYAVLAEWASQSPWMRCDNTDTPSTSTSGYVNFQDRAYIISSVVIYDELQVRQGYLILMRQVDDDVIHRAAEATGINMSLIPINPDLPALNIPRSAPLDVLEACQLCPSGLPVFCLSIKPRFAPPEFAEPEGVITVILFSSLPLLISVMALGILIEPIRRATRILEQHHEEGVISPIRLSSPVKILEFVQLESAYNAVAAKVADQRERLEQISSTDRLTRIPNRRTFDLAVQQAWKRIQRRHHSIAVVMVDIDYFKEYNDHFGHQTGDKALTRVAQALKTCSQRTDEMVARYGGEEFALIIYIKDAIELEKYRQRLKDAIDALDIQHPKSPLGGKLTISAGISWIKDPGDWLKGYSSQYWVELADVALYMTKLSGRNNSQLQILHKDLDKHTQNSFEDLQIMKEQIQEQLRQSGKTSYTANPVQK